MSESQEKCEECCSHEKCGSMCGHGFGCHKGFFFVRWIFGFIILALVFSVGVSIGRFAGEIDSYGGYGGLNSRGGYSGMMQYDGYNYGYTPGMMRGWVIQNQTVPTEITPATKTTK